MQINQNYEKKIPDTSNYINKSDDNTKINEIENKVPSISNLATKTASTTVENKIPSTNNLVRKTDITQRLVKLRIKLLIINMMNIQQLLDLINQLLMLLMREQQQPT